MCVGVPNAITLLVNRSVCCAILGLILSLPGQLERYGTYIPVPNQIDSSR